MPSLGAATEWLNSEPLGPAELRGHVVVVNFWTLTCVNWLRQEPYVRAWSRAYRDDGLIVIGVHTPEFSFEREVDGVNRAVEGVVDRHPVAIDNDYGIWRAFRNRYWPASYFVDAHGAIRERRFGEGRYEQSERTIQELLGVERELVSTGGLGVEAEADWHSLRTPETYVGYGRSEHFASPGSAALHERRIYELPRFLQLTQWALAGEWTIRDQHAVLEQGGGGIACRFHARDAHLVLSPVGAGADPVSRAHRQCAPGAVPWRRRRRRRERHLARRTSLRPRACARWGTRQNGADHVPRARRRGVRVHLRLGCADQAGTSSAEGRAFPALLSRCRVHPHDLPAVAVEAREAARVHEAEILSFIRLDGARRERASPTRRSRPLLTSRAGRAAARTPSPAPAGERGGRGGVGGERHQGAVVERLGAVGVGRRTVSQSIPAGFELTKPEPVPVVEALSA